MPDGKPDGNPADRSRPPLIFLMADHLRCDVLGPYGDRQTPTPAIDAFSEKAAVFEHHYTTCPLCVPARSSVMTGLYPWQHGAVINGWLPRERRYGVVRPDAALLPQRLIDAGYHVAHVGVQHVRTEPDLWQRLPDVEFVGPFNHSEHRKELDERGLYLGDRSVFRTPVVEYQNGKAVPFPANSPHVAVFPLREELFYDSVLAARMAKAIETHVDRADGKPLALFGMFWLPHPPLWAPEEFANLIKPRHVLMPANTGKWYAGMPAMQLLNTPGHLGSHVTMDQWRQAWAMYIGMVALLDKCVGQVLDAVQQAGLFDDAAIAITSDHGEMLGSHGMFQKMCMYEEAARVPLLLKLPGQKHTKRAKALTSHVDLPTTWLNLAGCEPIDESEGMDLRPLADPHAGSIETRPHVFASFDGNAGRAFHHRMARSHTHKLIHNIGDRAELYDLHDDPRESRNLAGDEEHREVEQELRDALREWMEHVGDPHPKP